MTIAIARPLRVPRKMGTDWPVMAMMLKSRIAGDKPVTVPNPMNESKTSG
jgi:hypothetical protein